MTPEQIRAIGPDFSNYLQQFDLCCDYPQTFRLLSVYCHGLLSDLDRKSAEPLALASGVAVRTLQEFLRDHLWSFRSARDILHQDLVAALPPLPADDLGTVGIVDETSVVKKGTKTPGVQRQWCGAMGKKENCIVTVHLGVARGAFQTLVDAELFLPKSWSDDRERCREADIPDELEYRPKWKIALRQVLRAGAAGLDLQWLTFDEGYGSKPGFLDGLDALGMSYVGEVPCSFACFTRPPSGAVSGHRADDLVRHSPVFHGQEWQEVRLPRQTLGPQTWAAKMAPIYVRRADRTGFAQRWLLVAWNVRTGEEKYFVCGGREADLTVRLRVGFTRFNVEHSFRIAKTELGFSHYEGRSYTGLMRHMLLCLVTQGFVAKEAASFRGEKSGGDDGAGLPGVEPVVLFVLSDPQSGCHGRGVVGGDEWVLPAAQPGGPGSASAADSTAAGTTTAPPPKKAQAWKISLGTVAL
jgi:SRSO17 transposase